MNYYSATNQSFLITPSQEPVKSIKTSLKKFSKFVAIGMAGIVSWMTITTNDAEFQGGISSPGAPEIVIKDESEEKWEAAYQSKSDEDMMVVTDDFSSREESGETILEPITEPVSSESVPESEPSHSDDVEFEFSEDVTITLEDTVRENTGSVSLDREVYPAPYLEPSHAMDIDPLFLSITIPIIVIVSGIILERILTRWYNKRKLKK